MTKQQSDDALVNGAERVGRTLGRMAKGLDRVTTGPKKRAPARSPKAQPKAARPKSDPVAAAKRTRESWKVEIHHAADAVKSQHGVAVDERALARATDGQRWAARKPR